MFGATELFAEGLNLKSDDVHEIAKIIVETECAANHTQHELKLARIEIGLAIRHVAAMTGSTLTETIDSMGLCRSLNRAEKTFLKYARIAGSASLLKMAANPQVSLSTLDEIASCKKPVDPAKRKEFMRRIATELEDKCMERRVEEGEDGEPVDPLLASGPTRREVIENINRRQTEFEVPKKGGGDRPDKKRRRELRLIRMLAELSSLYRVLFLPREKLDAWLNLNGVTHGDVGSELIELQRKLIEEGVLPENPAAFKATSCSGLRKAMGLPEPEGEDETDAIPEKAESSEVQ